MSRRLLLLLAISTLAQTLACSQRDGASGGTVQSTGTSVGSEFDFLVGQWDVDVIPKPLGLAQRIHGAPRLAGTWKAWRSSDGLGVEDELRIVDRSGNPVALIRATRRFDTTTQRWSQSVIDVDRGRTTDSEGAWADDVMTLTGSATDAEGRPTLVRVRFHDVTPTAFKYQADRSSDGGRTWETGITRMEATRVAAIAPR